MYRSVLKTPVILLLGALSFADCSQSPAPKVEKDLQTRPIADSRNKRVALVMGNAAYKTVSALKNPVRDADAISNALKINGFEVLEGTDLTHTQMVNLIYDFGKRLEKGGTALFFYSGHGVQSHDFNYLIPIDARIEAEHHLETNAIDVRRILGEMEGHQSQLNIVMLDACRDNPFKSFARSANRGLIQMSSPSGTLISYATAPGNVAQDGDGLNSPYTIAFLKQLNTDCLELGQHFRKMREQVSDATQKQQIPWESSSVMGEFYFKACPQAGATVMPVPPAVAPVADAAEVAFASLQKSEKLADWQSFVKTYPKNAHLKAAQNQITELQKKLKTALQDANALKKDFPADAHIEFLKAKNIAPDDPDVKALERDLPAVVK